MLSINGLWTFFPLWHYLSVKKYNVKISKLATVFFTISTINCKIQENNFFFLISKVTEITTVSGATATYAQSLEAIDNPTC